MRRIGFGYATVKQFATDEHRALDAKTSPGACADRVGAAALPSSPGRARVRLYSPLARHSRMWASGSTARSARELLRRVRRLSNTCAAIRPFFRQTTRVE